MRQTTAKRPLNSVRTNATVWAPCDTSGSRLVGTRLRRWGGGDCRVVEAYVAGCGCRTVALAIFRIYRGRDRSYGSDSKHTHAGAETVWAMNASRTRSRGRFTVFLDLYVSGHSCETPCPGTGWGIAYARIQIRTIPFRRAKNHPGLQLACRMSTMGDYAWSARRAALVLLTHFSRAVSQRGYLCFVHCSSPSFGRSEQEHEHKGNENKSAKYGLTALNDRIKLYPRPCDGKPRTGNQTVTEMTKVRAPRFPYHGLCRPNLT